MNTKGSKHLTLKERKIIEAGLLCGKKCYEIACDIGKSERCISAEISKNRYLKHNKRISYSSINADDERCKKIERYPFVCDNCYKKHRCRILEMFFYDAESAQIKYESTLSESRTGINITDENYKFVDRTIRDGVGKGQSIYHILETNRLPVSTSTIYKWIDLNFLTVKNIDLKRKVKMKRRKCSQENLEKRTREHFIGRKYVDYMAYLLIEKPFNIVQMDTVLGPIGSSDAILTLHFIRFRFMLAFKIPSLSNENVTDVFKKLRASLTYEEYKTLFSVVLTDRGREFSNPSAIEVDEETGEITTRVFYCDPQQSNQKAEIEENHTLLRNIIPKGTDVGFLTDELLNTAMSHINSYKRKVIDDTPYNLFTNIFDSHLAEKLKVRHIEPDLVYLKPALLFRK